MACRGEHFALTEDEVNRLKSLKSDDDRLDYVQEEIEEEYFSQYPRFLAETDKAWDAIHRSLTNGMLGYDNGDFPLNHVILGGDPIYSKEDYIMTLKTPDQVRAIAVAISGITKEEFRRGYDSIDPKDYGLPLGDEDFEYSWDWFSGLISFYRTAAENERFVLFTVDQ